MDVQFSHCHSLQRLSFPHFMFLVLLSQLDYICLGLFLGSLFCSTDLYICYKTILYCFDYYSFEIQLKSGYMIPPGLFFLIIAFCCLGPFVVPYKVDFYFSISVKNTIGILTWIIGSLQLALGSMDILTLIFPVNKYGTSFHYLCLQYLSLMSFSFQYRDLSPP